MTWNLRLVDARKAAVLSRTQLAELVGVSAAALSNWETGVTLDLSSDNLLKLCDALKVTPLWLLRGDGFGPGMAPQGLNLGERIRAARTALGLTQEALAERINRTKGAVSQWETNVAAPGADVIGPLADILGVSTDWLLGLDNRDLASASRTRSQISGLALLSKITTALAHDKLAQCHIDLLDDLLAQLVLARASTKDSLGAIARQSSEELT